MHSRLLLLAACALSFSGAYADEHEKPEAPDAGKPDVEERVCFNRRQVSTFDGLSDRHVFIKEGVSRFYLVTMRQHCSGLRDARTIAFKDTMNRVCSNGFGQVIYSGFGRGDRCRIATIERVQNKDEAKALVAEREDYEKRKKKDKD